MELLTGHQRDGLDRALQRDAEQCGNILAGRLLGRFHLAHGLLRRLASRRRGHRLSQLDVGGEIGMLAIGQRILTGIGQHVELV